MAAAATGGGNSGIFWINSVSDEEQPLVFVPGLEGEAKTRTSSTPGPGITSMFSKRGTKTRARRSSDSKNETKLKKNSLFQSERSGVYTKEKVSLHHTAAAAAVHSISPATEVFQPSTQTIFESSSVKSMVCLKDLCPEDKRRIANLIEELARVSEEKEESVQRLKDEQETFEQKIQQLEQQNLTIAEERESLQQQYRECQELLGLYQQYLSQQQAKLNQSIAQLSQAPVHSQVLSSEEAPSRTSTSRANGVLFDGSYLSFAASQARQPQEPRRGGGGGGEAQTFSNVASLSCTSEFSPTDRPIRQHKSQKRQCREPHSDSYCCQHTGHDSGYGTQQRRTDKGCCHEKNHHYTSNHHEGQRLHSGIAIGAEAEESLTRPLGHEDWEEKRHQLLLQKMQLEMERERLHARLAEQEERLNRQNQQLHQSRLDNSSSSKMRNGDPQLERRSHQDSLSSVCEETEAHPARRNLSEKPSQTDPAPQETEALEQSKKDVATSPPKSPPSLSKPNSVSAIQKTPEARLDFSLVELVDIFTPVSVPELNKLSTGRPKTSRRRPALSAPKALGRTLLTPAGPHPQHAQQELEESQILEDLFFMC